MTTTTTPASAPTTPDAVHAPLEGSPGIPFRRLLEVERRKIVDTRSGAWLLGITALLTALTLAVMLIWGESDGLGFMGLLSVATMPLSLLLPILGILTATTEWSQRTALVTFTLEPRRGRVVVAKLLAVVRLSLTVLVLTIAASALFYVASTTVRDGPADWSYEPAVVAKLLLLLTIYLVQGLAFGLLFLNTPAAIVTSLLLPVVFTVATTIVVALERFTPWVDLLVASEPLMAGSMGGTEWAHLGTASLLWLGLPMAVGTWRVLTKEIA
mgnify:FL=1